MPKWEVKIYRHQTNSMCEKVPLILFIYLIQCHALIKALSGKTSREISWDILKNGAWYARYSTEYGWLKKISWNMADVIAMPVDGLAPSGTITCADVGGPWFRCYTCKGQIFLAATKQLYKWYFPSVCPSVCHTFLTMFPSSYHYEIFRSYYQWLK